MRLSVSLLVLTSKVSQCMSQSVIESVSECESQSGIESVSDL